MFASRLFVSFFLQRNVLLLQVVQRCLFFGYLLVGQGLGALDGLLSLFPFGPFFGGHGKDFGADFGIDGGTCDFLQDIGFLIVFAVQEAGELSLRQ